VANDYTNCDLNFVMFVGSTWTWRWGWTIRFIRTRRWTRTSSKYSLYTKSNQF